MFARRIASQDWNASTRAQVSRRRAALEGRGRIRPGLPGRRDGSRPAAHRVFDRGRGRAAWTSRRTFHRKPSTAVTVERITPARHISPPGRRDTLSTDPSSLHESKGRYPGWQSRRYRAGLCLYFLLPFRAGPPLFEMVSHFFGRRGVPIPDGRFRQVAHAAGRTQPPPHPCRTAPLPDCTLPPHKQPASGRDGTSAAAPRPAHSSRQPFRQHCADLAPLLVPCSAGPPAVPAKALCLLLDSPAPRSLPGLTTPPPSGRQLRQRRVDHRRRTPHASHMRRQPLCVRCRRPRRPALVQDRCSCVPRPASPGRGEGTGAVVSPPAGGGSARRPSGLGQG